MERPEMTSVFFDQIRKTGKSVLISDYEGTLTPPLKDRVTTYPYKGINQKLECLATLGCRVIILSSGKALDVLEAFGKDIPIEIWGFYGAERLDPGGILEVFYPETRQKEGLTLAYNLAKVFFTDEDLEITPLSVKASFRGPSKQGSDHPGHELEKEWIGLVSLNELRLLTFDGGMELRARGFDKGSAVRTILKDVSADCPCCYLGDDPSDEEPFNFIWGRGLTALVKKEHQESSAQIWLKPPSELLKFCDDWIWSLENWEIDSRD